MSWILRYRCRTFLRSSLCAIPIACVAAALLAAPLIRLIDERTQWTLMGFGLEGSRAVAEALASSLLTFIVFAFSIILLAVQIASSQLSPRIISRVLESRVATLTLGTFVFSYTYTLAALGRIENRVPELPVLVAVLSSLLSVVLFLYLIQQTGKSLRPGVILAGVAADTRVAIHHVYPNPFSARSGEYLDFISTPAQRTIAHSGHSGVVLAFDAVGLVKIAEQAGCSIELVPQLGDFLDHGENLFHLRGAGAGRVNERSLRRCVALGSEQTLDKDPAFGVRILVEIAAKALSAATNDPTTGVLAVDQLQHLLYLLSQRQLDTAFVRDSSGNTRLVYPTPCWEDFVTLAVTEIRLYGSTSPQVTRRLQAMLEHLVRVVPTERSGTLYNEMALLRRTIDRAFADPEDRILASVGDLQGFGSRQRHYSPEREHDGLSGEWTALKRTPD
jgi:uncharacterized membrane protein